MKACNGCTLCCKLLNVPELSRDGEQCRYACNGCEIHDDRPDQCRSFDCFWRAESWPAFLKPSKCNVLFEALPQATTILVTMDEKHPYAWTETNIIETIHKLVKKNRPVVVRNPEGITRFFLPEHITQQQVIEDVKKTLELNSDRSQLHN